MSKKLSDDLLKRNGKATSYKTNDRSVQQRSEESRSASDQLIKTSDDVYHDIALSAFRYLGCHSFEEVDRMTMSEFELRMIAF